MPEKTSQLAFTLADVVILSANTADEEFIIPCPQISQKHFFVQVVLTEVWSLS